MTKQAETLALSWCALNPAGYLADHAPKAQTSVFAQQIRFESPEVGT